MHAIISLSRAVARRLSINTAIQVFTRGIFLLLILFTLLLLADRIVYIGFLPLGSILAAVPLMALAAIAIAWRHRTRPEGAALILDDQLGLHERLSTALALGPTDDPAGRAVLLDAQRHAQAIRPAMHFPYRLPPEGRWIPVPAVALGLIALLMPPLDLFRRKEAADKRAQEEARVQAQAQELRERTRRLLKDNLTQVRRAETERVLKELDEASKELHAAKDKKEAFLKLSQVSEKLKDRKEELQKILDEHKRFRANDAADQTKELQEALARGDFDAAKRQLDRLREKLKEETKGGKGPGEQAQRLADELAKLSKQLGGLEQLAESLKNAADRLGSVDPEELKDALGALEGASDELAALERLAEEVSLLNQALEEVEAAQMALAGEQDPEGVEGGEPGEQEPCEVTGQMNPRCGRCGTCRGQGMAGLKSSRCGKCGRCAACQKQRQKGPGPGGGGGQGTGLREPGNLDSAGFEKTKVQGQLGKGEILGVFWVKGIPPKGDARVQYSDVVTRYKEVAEDALDKERIPGNYREVVREYFNAIENPVVESAPSDGEK